MSSTYLSIWHSSDDFLKIMSEAALTSFLEDDHKNNESIIVKCSNELGLLDKTIALYIELLQQIYRDRSSWEKQDNIRLSVAMANQSLNYFLLARHGITLGYLPEVYTLIRAVHEHMTRCLLFLINKDQVKRFFTTEPKEKLWQVDVEELLDRELAEHYDAEIKSIHPNLRALYRSMSELAHPNPELLTLRTLGANEEESKSNLGVEFIYGGFLSDVVALGSIARVLQSLLFSLSILRFLVLEVLKKWSEEWEKQYRSIQSAEAEIRQKAEKMIK